VKQSIQITAKTIQRKTAIFTAFSETSSAKSGNYRKVRLLTICADVVFASFVGFKVIFDC